MSHRVCSCFQPDVLKIISNYLESMEGYTKLASLFSEFPDLACLRRFSKLNFELLLYKQAELNHLELEIRAFEKKESAESARKWNVWNAETPDAMALEKQRLFQKLDEKMRSYRK